MMFFKVGIAGVEKNFGLTTSGIRVLVAFIGNDVRATRSWQHVQCRKNKNCCQLGIVVLGSRISLNLLLSLFIPIIAFFDTVIVRLAPICAMQRR